MSFADLKDDWICENQTIKQLFQERVENGDKIIVSKDVGITFCKPPSSEIEKTGCNNPQFGPIQWFDRFEKDSKIMPDLQKNIDRTTSGNLCVTIVLPHVSWEIKNIRSEYDLSVEHLKKIIQSKKTVVEYLTDNDVKEIFGGTLPSANFDASIPLSTNLAELASMDEIESIALNTSTGSTFLGQDKIDGNIQELFDTDPNINLKHFIFPLDEFGNISEGRGLRPANSIVNFDSKILERPDDVYVRITINIVHPIFSQDNLIEEWGEQGFVYKSNSELEAERTAKIAYMQHKLFRILNESGSTIGRINNDYVEANIPLSIVPKLESMSEVVLLDMYGKTPVIGITTTGYVISNTLKAKMNAGLETIKVNIHLTPLKLLPDQQAHNQAEHDRAMTIQEPLRKFLHDNDIEPNPGSRSDLTYFESQENNYIYANVPSELISKLAQVDNVKHLGTEWALTRSLGSGSNTIPLEFVLDVSDKGHNLDDVSMNVTVLESTAKIEIVGDSIHAIHIPKETLGKDIKVIHNGISTNTYEIVKQADGTQVLLLSPIANTTDTALSNDISSPRQQLKWGVLPEDIICNSDLILVINPNDSVACVKDHTVIKLIERGWKAIKQV